MADDISGMSVEVCLLQILSEMLRSGEISVRSKPLWVNKAKEILHDQFAEKQSLIELSHSLGIHPVHLSRDFPKYFRCSLGDYLRKLRIEKSLSLLTDKKYSLTQVSFECGFSDQSHFTRCFKEIIGINPLAYRKLYFS